MYVNPRNHGILHINHLSSFSGMAESNHLLSAGPEYIVKCGVGEGAKFMVTPSLNDNHTYINHRKEIGIEFVFYYFAPFVHGILFGNMSRGFIAKVYTFSVH